MTDIRLLPAPVLQTWEWQSRGACRRSDPSLFFHPTGERGHARRVRERRAKSVCSTCPVVSSCLSWAVLTRETYGVWGGLSEAERQELRA